MEEQKPKTNVQTSEMMANKRLKAGNCNKVKKYSTTVSLQSIGRSQEARKRVNG